MLQSFFQLELGGHDTTGLGMPEILLSEKKSAVIKFAGAAFPKRTVQEESKRGCFRKQEDRGQVPRPLNPRGLTSKEKAGITAGLAVSDFAFHPRDNGYAHPYCGAFSFGESAAELDSIGSLERGNVTAHLGRLRARAGTPGPTPLR